MTAKVTLNTKARVIENKIPDTTVLVTATEFNRLTKISFDARTKQEVKTLQVKVK